MTKRLFFSLFRFINHLQTKVNDLFKSMIPDSPIQRGNWAVFHDLDGPLDLYTPTGHEDRNEVGTMYTPGRLGGEGRG